MIVIDSLTKSYGHGRRARPPAVNALSLAVPRGAVYAIVGPNGAGKSTLFSLLLGFLHPTGGDITIDGIDPRRYVRRHGAGYLPERFMLPRDWRVGEALHAFARAERLPAARAAADDVLNRFGLGDDADTRIGALSHGTLQRVGLAQALLAPRALLVLDEPTEGLDPTWRLRLRDELDRLRAAGRTVLLASHDLGEVERTADCAVVLENGTIRDVLDTRSAASPTTYLLDLAEPSTHIAEVFPGAVPLNDAGTAHRVIVADAAELSARLAALLALGATLAAVQPLTEPLEARVRRALGGDVP